MDPLAFVALTLVAHGMFAIGIVVHARRRRTVDPRKWAGITLLFGLGGVAGYLLLAEG